MRFSFVTRRFIRPASAVFLAVGVVAGCSTDTLEITDPDVLNVGDYTTTAGATPLRLGVIADFQNVYGGNASLENMIVVTGNVSDELYSTDTFDGRLFPNQRAMNDNLPEMDTFYRNLHRVRAGATRTINVLRKVAPTPVPKVSRIVSGQSTAAPRQASPNRAQLASLASTTGRSSWGSSQSARGMRRQSGRLIASRAMRPSRSVGPGRPMPTRSARRSGSRAATASTTD
jgi:hypothetical protein